MGANPRGCLRACSLAVRSCLRSFIDEAGVPPAVIVGLSGGADSLALALTVIDVASRAGIEVVTLTVDHGLRAGSAHEARRVADLAASLGARALVETVRVDGRGGPEASARDARLAALRSLALREGAPVLLGHTMDDQAETVLLRLARGSGPSSLRAIAPIRRDEDGVTWLRPTNAIDGPWRAADGSALRRSAVRHSAIPALASALGVDPVPALARTAALCAADDDALSEWTRGLLAVSCEASPAAGEGCLALVVSEVSGAPRAVRARALREVASRAGIRLLSGVHVDALDDLIVAWRGQGPIPLPGGRATRVGRGTQARILFEARSPEPTRDGG